MHLVQHHVLQFLVVHRTHEYVGFQRLAYTIHKTRSDIEGLRHEMVEQQTQLLF
jgi:ribosomal protein S6